MRKLLAFTFIILAGVNYLFAQEKKEDQKPEIAFDKIEHDFGTIWDGVAKEYSFEFTNKGKVPLILSNVQPSCGCTAPAWPREPIMPGQKAKIVVVYSSGAYRNAFSKTITVSSNASNNNIVLTIKGVVKDKPREPVSPIKTQPSEGGF
jgi:hypothetical protein